MQNVKTLTRARFDAFVTGQRWAGAPAYGEELEWYSDGFERVIGVVCRDTTDNDYLYVVLGRDESRRFRWIDGRVSMPNVGMARSRLKVRLRELSAKVQEIFPQGADEALGQDPFTPVVDKAKFHPGFALLQGHDVWSPAHGIMTELMRHFVDIDGNFVEQLQTTGFDSRIWELYLYAYFKEANLLVDRSHNAPDFIIETAGYRAAVEAVTVGPSPKTAEIEQHAKDLETSEGIRAALNDYMPIKFGGTLGNKLKKAYWELPQVKDLPLVFAIADFHDKRSMLWSSTALIEYLYGARHDFYFDDKKQLIISPLKIDTHQVGKKVVPSGFFFQPGAENVSAVLFSASGTLSKFNRMGRLAGFGVKNLHMEQFGLCYDHDPNAPLPLSFHREIAPGKCDETWGEGLALYHNPNALRPVPRFLFPNIAQFDFEKGQIVGQVPHFQPFSSLTINVLLT